MRGILRKIRAYLSIYSDKPLPALNKKEERILNFLSKLGKKIQNKKINKNKLKTHKLFSKKILEIIVSKKIRSFLRIGFVQQMFFVHNRSYIFDELKILKKDTQKWNIWKKLLNEDRVGHPIRYFLYSQSSGNRIRQVFHLKNLCDFVNFNINKYDLVLEIGGGYGNMARLFNKINKNTKFIIYDTEEVNLLQYYYLKMNKVRVSFSFKRNANVYLVNNVLNLKSILSRLRMNNRKNLLISNWGLSEMPLILRQKLKFAILLFDYQLISFQNNFENINNCSYFEKLIKQIRKKLNIKSTFKEITTMSNALSLSGTKHNYLLIKKNKKN